MSSWLEEGEELGEDGMAHGGANQEVNRVQDKLYNDGYRIGKAAEEEREAQRGFDEGFKKGSETARVCGRFYGNVRRRIQDRAVHQRVETILFHSIPESGKVLQSHLQQLEDAFSSLKKEDTAWLADFFRELAPLVIDTDH